MFMSRNWYKSNNGCLEGMYHCVPQHQILCFIVLFLVLAFLQCILLEVTLLELMAFSSL